MNDRIKAREQEYRDIGRRFAVNKNRGQHGMNGLVGSREPGNGMTGLGKQTEERHVG